MVNALQAFDTLFCFLDNYAQNYSCFVVQFAQLSVASCGAESAFAARFFFFLGGASFACRSTYACQRSGLRVRVRCSACSFFHA